MLNTDKTYILTVFNWWCSFIKLALKMHSMDYNKILGTFGKSSAPSDFKFSWEISSPLSAETA